MQVPAQAAILCGGRGTRLRPHTDTVPKPMVEVAGRPFLEHLLCQLAQQGVNRFVLMTGYLGHQISQYFGDGSRWGWSIRYSQGPIGWATGRRIVEAEGLLDDRYLLLYSDNFALFDIRELVNRHHSTKRSLTLTLKSKPGGNCRYSAEAGVVVYDTTRLDHGLEYVEIGYMVAEREAVSQFLADVGGFPNVEFSEALSLVARAGVLGGYPISAAYYSISDPVRLEITRDYFLPKKILLVDRDGTISKRLPRGHYVETWEQFDFQSESVQAMKELSAEGFVFIVITNQAGISLGVVDEAEVEHIHAKMTAELAQLGITVLDVYMSPDHWNSESTTRKPAPGMFHLASEQHRFRLDQVLYVGDDIRDCQAAAAAGCGMVFLSDDREVEKLPVNRHHQSVHRSFTDALGMIKGYYEEGEDS